MNTHHQRGVAHVLVPVIIILIGLGILARLDIDNAETGPDAHPEREYRHAPDDTNPYRSGNDMDGSAALQHGL